MDRVLKNLCYIGIGHNGIGIGRYEKTFIGFLSGFIGIGWYEKKLIGGTLPTSKYVC